MSLIDILQDGQTAIELVAEISHRDPETDIESVTYLSRHGTVPSTGPSDTPANQTFPDRLLSLGPIRESLNEDLLFSGLSSYELGGLTIDNTPTSSPPASGPLDSWLNLSFAGKNVVIKAGAQGAAYSTFETIVSGTSNGNPTFRGNEISLTLQSVFSKLDIPLIVNRYVGIPSNVRFLTTSGSYSQPYIAAYALSSYTAMCRFKIPAATANNQFLIRQGNATLNQRIGLYVGSTGGGFSGKVRFRASFGGASVEMITSPLTYVDGKYHTVIIAIQDKTTAYLIIDNHVVGTYTPTLSVDAPTDPINNANLIGSILDIRLINTYLTPDEAIARFSSRAEGDETGTVSCLRFDDGGGATVTDYSTNANNASLVGVLDTAYTWEPSDLGMPEQAGLPMPIVYGDVFNAPLDLIDTVNERDRWHDGLSVAPSTYNADLTVKVRGVPITEGVDWDHQPDVSTGVIETTSEIDQPATFDTEVDTPGSYPNSITEFLLVDRGGFNSASDIRLDWLDAMSYLLPTPSGVFVKGSDKTLGGVVGEYLTGIGGHLRLDTPTGKFIPSHLLPPVGPSPVDADDSVLEWVGSPDDGIDFGDIANPTSHMSLACWFKTHRGFQDATAGLYLQAPMINKNGASTGYRLLIHALGNLEFSYANVATISLATPRAIKPEVWYFVLASFNDTTNVANLYLGELGGAMIQVGSVTGSAAVPATNTLPLLIGNDQPGNFPFLGSIAHAQVWSKAHTLAEAQTLMDQFEAGTPLVGNEANLLFYAPINDGVGSTTVQNLVGPTTGTISGLCRWAPQLILDFTTAQPNGSIDSLSRLIPAGDIEIRYKVNHSPLTQSDIAASVTDENALPLKLPYLSLKPDRADIKDDFSQTRSILLTSPFLRQSAAIYLYNLLSSRFGPDNMLVNVSGVSRDGMLLNLTDEIRVIGSHSSLSSGVHFRVVEKSNSLDELTTNLRLALGQIP